MSPPKNKQKARNDRRRKTDEENERNEAKDEKIGQRWEVQEQDFLRI